MALGAFFVLFQGYEWVMMIGQGLTLTSSNHGSFFYLIVGLHARTWWSRSACSRGRGLLRARLARQQQLAAAQVFWFFVVGLWPVLYFLVYT